MSKEWNSPEAWRMYRLGMMYTFITGLSAVTNTQWSNLIQNDTLERLDRLDQWLGGTDEEKEKAFYGRGPVTATFGGPMVSDILRIGSLINFDDLSGDEWESYTKGYADFHNRTGKKSNTEEILRTLNTQVGRSIFTTVPRMINGTSIPTLLGQELGLYKTRDVEFPFSYGISSYQDLRDNMLYPLQLSLIHI